MTVTLRARPDAAPSAAALVLLVGISPLATDAYLPALPALRASLSTSTSVAQLTLTAFLVAIALGQIVIGPFSDATGRRPVLLVCSLGFAGSSLLCALAPSASTLVVLRALQGAFAGGATAAARAVVSDRFTGIEAAQRFGTLASVSLIAPVVAPSIGSAILAFGDWRTVFAGLALVGAAQVTSVLLRINESLPPARRGATSLRATLGRMGDLLGDRDYMRHVVPQCCANMGFFTYIGGSSFALQSAFGLSESRYAFVFTVNAIAMIATSLVFRVLVARVGSPRLRRVGLGLTLTGSTVVLLSALTVEGVLAVPWAGLACVTAGMGLVLPSSFALAQAAGRRWGGTASALSGGLAFGMGALVTPLTGALGAGTLVPMGALMTGFMALALVALFAYRSTRTR